MLWTVANSRVKDCSLTVEQSFPLKSTNSVELTLDSLERRFLLLGNCVTDLEVTANRYSVGFCTCVS